MYSLCWSYILNLWFELILSFKERTTYLRMFPWFYNAIRAVSTIVAGPATSTLPSSLIATRKSPPRLEHCRAVKEKQCCYFIFHFVYFKSVYIICWLSCKIFWKIYHIISSCQAGWTNKVSTLCELILSRVTNKPSFQKDKSESFITCSKFKYPN